MAGRIHRIIQSCSYYVEAEKCSPNDDARNNNHKDKYDDGFADLLGHILESLDIPPLCNKKFYYPSELPEIESTEITHSSASTLSKKENLNTIKEENSSGPPSKKVKRNIDVLDAILLNKQVRTTSPDQKEHVPKPLPSLASLASKVMKKNLVDCGYTGGAQYTTLRPILMKVSSEQLLTIERKNRYLLRDTDEVWKQYCNKKFRGRKPRQHETWRDMFRRCKRERDNRDRR